jgi:hypothetical protein
MCILLSITADQVTCEYNEEGCILKECRTYLIEAGVDGQNDDCTDLSFASSKFKAIEGLNKGEETRRT